MKIHICACIYKNSKKNWRLSQCIYTCTLWIPKKKTVESRAGKFEQDIFELIVSPESILNMFICICVHIWISEKKNRQKPSGEIRGGCPWWADWCPRKLSPYNHIIMRIHMNIEEKQTVKSRAEKVEEDIFDELFDSPESWLDIFIYICVYIYEYPKKTNWRLSQDIHTYKHGCKKKKPSKAERKKSRRISLMSWSMSPTVVSIYLYIYAYIYMNIQKKNWRLSPYIHTYKHGYLKKKPSKAERKKSRRISLISWSIPPKVVSIYSATISSFKRRGRWMNVENFSKVSSILILYRIRYI